MAVGADDIARVLHVLHVLLLARHRLKSNESADAGHVRWVHALGHGIWCHTHHCWVHRHALAVRHLPLHGLLGGGVDHRHLLRHVRHGVGSVKALLDERLGALVHKDGL